MHCVDERAYYLESVDWAINEKLKENMSIISGNFDMLEEWGALKELDRFFKGKHNIWIISFEFLSDSFG